MPAHKTMQEIWRDARKKHPGDLNAATEEYRRELEKRGMRNDPVFAAPSVGGVRGTLKIR